MLIYMSLSTISCNSRENKKKNTNVIKLKYTYKYCVCLDGIKLGSYQNKVLFRTNIVVIDTSPKVISQVFRRTLIIVDKNFAPIWL